MDANLACTIAKTAAELVRVCASFQAQFGRQYRVKPGSPEEAWALYHAIFNKQVEIAALLDTHVLHNASPQSKWWERQESLDVAIAEDIMKAAGHLIASSAYFAAQPKGTDWSYAVFCAQNVLAGLLHPAARQVALSSTEVKDARYAG